jgi:hypothetical protein
LESISGENRCLVTDKPVDFEKQPVVFEELPVEVGGFRRNTDHLRGIYLIYLK